MNFQVQFLTFLLILVRSHGASIGITFYDDMECKSGAIATAMKPSPVCSPGEGPAGIKFSIQMVAVGDGSTIVSTTGFPTADCTFPAAASAGGIGGALVSSVSFYDFGMSPVNICRPCSSAFALFSGKKSYKINTLSDPNIFGIFLACVAAVIGIYIFYMYRTKTGPYAESQDWKSYLLGLWTLISNEFKTRCTRHKILPTDTTDTKIDVVSSSDPTVSTDQTSKVIIKEAAEKGLDKTEVPVTTSA